ncbi:MAG: lipoprotein insertase outer membrane protein LolB [Candidatus Methylumidiphilus sp.]
MRLMHFALACELAFGGLSGCAWLPDKPVAPPAQASWQKLYQIPAWKLEGRIAAKMGQEGWNANLSWEHEDGQERLRIFGPFNQGAVSILVQSDAVIVNDGGGEVLSLRDPDAWMKERLGFTVPLRSLRYWVLGLPDPGGEYKAAGDGSGFEQQAWVLAVERFEAIGDWVLPKKMALRGDAVTLKLIVDEWFFNQ